MPTKSKRIKPHKGGRTARAPEARIKPESLKKLRAILDARHISFADWLEEKISESASQHIGSAAAKCRR